MLRVGSPQLSTPLFEVRASAGKGQGGFATRDIHVGEQILTERPLARWRSTDGDASELVKIIGAMATPDRQDFFALSQAEQHGNTKSELGIWLSNAYPTTAGEGGVYSLACRLNHNCRPNAHQHWNDRTGMQTVMALREILAGEEVFVAYIGGDADGTRVARQSQLQQKFSFTCRCPQCEMSGAALEQSETRQRRIAAIVALLQAKPSNAVALVQERVDLMEAERMPAVWGKSGALLALMSLPRDTKAVTRKLAWRLATRARDYCQIALGGDADETIAFESFAANPAFAKLNRQSGQRCSSSALSAPRQRPRQVQQQVQVQQEEVQRADQNLDRLAAQRAVAVQALADAAAEEAEAAARESGARQRASDAVGACSGDASALLTLARDGRRGSLWTFASGTFDNLRISYSDVEYAAARLADGVRRTLLDDTVDAALLSYLRRAPYAATWTDATDAGAASTVTRRAASIGAAGCRALRGAIDARRDATTDTVDHFAQHTLHLSLESLRGLVGAAAVEALEEMPMALLEQRRDDAARRARGEAAALREETQTRATHDPQQGESSAPAASGGPGTTPGATTGGAGRLEAALSRARAAAATARRAAADGLTLQMYIRRYSTDTRPWLGFHTDRSAVTINVALAADAAHEGGRLHAILGGEHAIVERDEGEATVHGDDVMHAVSSMRHGVRYSLVMLYFLGE